MDVKQEIKEFRDKWYSYDAKILSRKRYYDSLEELEEKLENSQFAIDLEGYHFEWLFIEKTEYLFENRSWEYLYVIYNAAQDDNNGVPTFPRWGYHNLFDGCMLCIEDPMYYKFPNMKAGSFYGDNEKSCVALSLEIIKAVCQKMKISKDKIIFFSSSQGGFTSTYASTLMPNTLSIAVNPQLYIQDAMYTKNFIDVSGIDLEAPDPLHRNDIVHCIKNSFSKHVIIINIQSEWDWIRQGIRFCRDFGMKAGYGITIKDNCLFWLYDCAGAPNSHVANETKSIFMFIDKIAKAFYTDEVTEEMCRDAMIINECWHDIYELKKTNFMLKNTNAPDFAYIRGDKCLLIENLWCSVIS